MIRSGARRIIPAGPTELITGSSGAYLQHNATYVSGFGTFRDRPVGNIAVFPSHEVQTGTDGIDDMWWLSDWCIPAGYTGDISIAMPMCADGQTVSTDISTQVTTVANALSTFNGGINRFFIRLGWEMNLGTWPWTATNSNLPTWKSRWGGYADIFHGVLGSRAVMVWNTNGGPNGGGALTSTVDNCYVDGKVDAVGTDQYDDYPGMTNDSNVAIQRTRTQGLDWHATLARAKDVPLCLPEWGASSGSQWSGHTGGDNERYIDEIFQWFWVDNGDIALYESYFNEPSSFIASDIWRPSGTAANPIAGARYAQLWGQP